MSKGFSLRGLAAGLLALATVTGPLTLPAQANSFQTFDGTVMIQSCSASVIQMPGANDSDKALIMTNGHCIKPVFDRHLKRGEVITNYSLWATPKPQFKEIAFVGGNQPSELLRGKLTDVVYATVDNTDLAILRSDKTYSQLRQAGVKIRPLSSSRPTAGTQIQIPSSFWRKAYACSIEAFPHELHEGQWIWKDAIRYTSTGCNVQGGSSGSPIVDVSTGAIIGINNTGADGGEACAFNNPCEVDSAGRKAVIPGRSYGTQTYYMPTCFTGSSLTMNKAGCLLPKKH